MHKQIASLVILVLLLTTIPHVSASRPAQGDLYEAVDDANLIIVGEFFLVVESGSRIVKLGPPRKNKKERPPGREEDLGERVVEYEVVELKIIDVLKGRWDRETLRYSINSDHQFWLFHNFELHEPGIWFFRVGRFGNLSLRRYLPKHYIHEIRYLLEHYQ